MKYAYKNIRNIDTQYPYDVYENGEYKYSCSEVDPGIVIVSGNTKTVYGSGNTTYIGNSLSYIKNNKIIEIEEIDKEEYLFLKKGKIKCGGFIRQHDVPEVINITSKINIFPHGGDRMIWEDENHYYKASFLSEKMQDFIQTNKKFFK